MYTHVKLAIERSDEIPRCVRSQRNGASKEEMVEIEVPEYLTYRMVWW